MRSHTRDFLIRPAHKLFWFLFFFCAGCCCCRCWVRACSLSCRIFGTNTKSRPHTRIECETKDQREATIVGCGYFRHLRISASDARNNKYACVHRQKQHRQRQEKNVYLLLRSTCTFILCRSTASWRWDRSFLFHFVSAINHRRCNYTFFAV